MQSYDPHWKHLQERSDITIPPVLSFLTCPGTCVARSPRWRRQHEVSGAQARQQQRQPPPRRVASTCLGSPIRALRDPRCMFTLPSFTEQFPLPPPFSTRLGASRRASWGNPQQTARLPFQPSLNRGGLVGAGRWCAYEGRQREEGPELRSCGVLLLSLRGTRSNVATVVALGGVRKGAERRT